MFVTDETSTDELVGMPFAPLGIVISLSYLRTSATLEVYSTFPLKKRFPNGTGEAC